MEWITFIADRSDFCMTWCSNFVSLSFLPSFSYFLSSSCFNDPYMFENMPVSSFDSLVKISGWFECCFKKHLECPRNFNSLETGWWNSAMFFARVETLALLPTFHWTEGKTNYFEVQFLVKYYRRSCALHFLNMFPLSFIVWFYRSKRLLRS